MKLHFDREELPLDPSDSGDAARLLQWAREAQTAGRIEDMVVFMAMVLDKSPGSRFSGDQRQMFSDGIQAIIGTRTDAAKKIVDEPYRLLVWHEIAMICGDLITMLERQLEERTDMGEEEKFLFLKLTGDLYWYRAQSETANRDRWGANSLDYFRKAEGLATRVVGPTDILYLEMILHFSACLYDLGNNRKEAIALSRRTFDDGINRLSGLDEAEYRKVSTLLKQIQENLALWTDGDED